MQKVHEEQFYILHGYYFLFQGELRIIGFSLQENLRKIFEQIDDVHVRVPYLKVHELYNFVMEFKGYSIELNAMLKTKILAEICWNYFAGSIHWISFCLLFVPVINLLQLLRSFRDIQVFLNKRKCKHFFSEDTTCRLQMIVQHEDTWNLPVVRITDEL